VKAQERRRPINGRSRGNGATLDGQLVEVSARPGDGGVLEGQADEGLEGFDVTGVEAGDKIKGETESARSPAPPKDALRGS
jgi:hypothetical protein